MFTNNRQGCIWPADHRCWPRITLSAVSYTLLVFNTTRQMPLSLYSFALSYVISFLTLPSWSPTLRLSAVMSLWSPLWDLLWPWVYLVLDLGALGVKANQMEWDVTDYTRIWIPVLGCCFHGAWEFVDQWPSGPLWLPRTCSYGDPPGILTWILTAFDDWVGRRYMN